MPDTNLHITAFRPLARDTVSFRISGADASKHVDAGARCRALVKLINPSVESLGRAKNCEHWVVRFVAEDLITFQNFIAEGNTVEADRLGNKWPELRIQKRPHIMNGICTLECSARELGGRKQ